MNATIRARTKDAVQAAQIAVAVTRARWETVNEIDRETRTAVLSSGKYRTEDGEVITNPRDDFMMTAEDFAEYCKEAYTANREKGLDSGSWELTFWPIQKAAIDAENALIDLIPSCVPQIDAATHGKMKLYPHREKALDLMLNVDTRTMPDDL